MSTSAAWRNRIKAIVFGLGLGLILHMSGNWWNIFSYRIPQCQFENCVADFLAFYAEGKLMLENRRLLYDLDQQLIYQNAVARTEKVLPFAYPPITAAFYSALAFLTFPLAFLVMSLLNILLFAASLRLLIQRLNLSPDQRDWLLLFTFCNFAVQAVVFNAHTSALVLYFLTRHVVAQKEHKDTHAGFWAALLSIKPQYLPIPHLVLLLQKKWRGLAVGASITIVLTAGAFLWLGSETTKDYIRLAQHMVTHDADWWSEWRSMHNLRALTTFWLTPNWHIYTWWGCIAVTLALVAWVNWRAYQQPNCFAACWIVNILALLLVSPHIFTHDLSLLIIPCALLLSIGKQQVPIGLGLGLILIAVLPAINYLLPTIMATTLFILFLLSLSLTKLRWAQS
jgi:arabinofuranan 3-O-arabinosyltransferase